MTVLLKHGSGLGLDKNRIGIIASSNNGQIGIKLALDNRPEYVSAFRAAAFIHASIRPVAITRKDIPIFIIYTDKEGTVYEGLAKAFIERGGRAGLEITVRDDAPFKGFEYDEPTPLSKEILVHMLEFMDTHLRP